MAKRRVLKVFVSSPGDVPEARAEVIRQVEQLNSDPEIAAGFLLEILKWEESAPPLVGRAPQAIVNGYTGRAGAADIVICVFGRRFGTEVILGGRHYPSGTYYEFHAAEQAHRRNRAGKPVILLYRMLRERPPQESLEEAEQAAKVEEFFHSFQGRDAIYRGLYEEYRDTAEFGAALACKLKRVILQEFPPPQVGGRVRSLVRRLRLGIDPEASRRNMLRKVRHDWIEGVLNDLTARVVAPFEIDIHVGEGFAGDATLPAASAPHLRAGDYLRALFDHADHHLLILGKPGAGKTFKLLELTSALLDRAEENTDAPIPVVFNLSSWAGHRWPIADWLVAELVSVYGLPRKVAKKLVQSEKLALCLDGLDEITVGGATSASEQEADARTLREDCRRECLQALNDYIAETGVWVALCCRDEEYAALGTKLRTRHGDVATITVARLSDAQVEQHLDAAKWELEALRQAIAADSTLRELARTPFLLTTMAIAYRDEQGVSAAGILGGGKDGRDARLIDLFEKYLSVRYDRTVSARARRYSLARIRYYLGVLAQKMEEGNSKVLLVEQLQPDWLPPASRWQYVALVSLLLALIVCITVGIPAGLGIGYEWAAHPAYGLSGGLRHGITCLLAVSLCCGAVIGAGFAISRTWGFGVTLGLTSGVGRGLVAGLSRIEGGLIFGLRVGLITAVVVTLVFAPLIKLRRHARDEIRPLENRKWDARKAMLGVVAALVEGLVYWVAFGPARGLGFSIAQAPIFALAFGEFGTRFEIKTYPNQGIRHSAATALWVALLSAPAGMICFGLSYWLVLGEEQGIVNIFLGLALSASTLLFGAIPAMQHLSLRLVLRAHRLAPLRLVEFLNAASDLHLLRRVGGSYMFQHEYLREYFRARHRLDQEQEAFQRAAGHEFREA
jgi:hypothetical protein